MPHCIRPCDWAHAKVYSLPSDDQMSTLRSTIAHSRLIVRLAEGCRWLAMPVSTASGHTVKAFRVSDHGQVRVGDDYTPSFGDANNGGTQIGHNSGSVTNTFNLSALGRSLSSHCLSKAAQRVDLTYRILSASHFSISFDCHSIWTRPRLCASRCAGRGVATHEGAGRACWACRAGSRVRYVTDGGPDD